MTTTAILLVLASLALVVLEAAIPSFGLFGLLAAASYVYALVIGFRESRELGIWIVALGVLLAPPAFFLGMRILGRSRLGRAMIPPAPDSGAVRDADAAMSALAGRASVAVTPLRPGGRVECDGARYEAESVCGFVEKGAALRVVAAKHGRLIVEKTSPDGHGAERNL